MDRPGGVCDRMRTAMISIQTGCLVLGAVVALGACAPTTGAFGPEPLNPTSRFTLQVEPNIDRIALAVHDGGLSATQQSAVRDLVGRFAASDAGVVRIEGPSGGDDGAGRMTWAVRDAVAHAGVPRDRIEVVGYNAPDGRAPVLVGFETFTAAVPRCGTAWEDLALNPGNRTSSNFGCAVHANLAAQISNPADIMRPRAETPSHAGRRTVVFDRYRRGETTAAPQEELVARVGVSQAVE